MPDVQEVFRMSTQKVEQERGALERQFKRRDRRTRNRKLGALAVAGLVVVAAAVLILSSQPTGEGGSTVPATNPPAPSVVPGAYLLDVSNGGTTPLTGAAAEGRDFDATRDGSSVAFTRDTSGVPQIYVMRSDGSDIRKVTRDPLGVESAAWAPDGTQLAYVGIGKGPDVARNIFVLDLQTGDTTQLTHERDDVLRMEWSPDADTILFSVNVGTAGSDGPTSGGKFELRTVAVNTGRVRTLAEGASPEASASEGTWSPDGSRIAFMRGIDASDALGFDSAEIWTMDADGRNQRRILAIDTPAIGTTWSPNGTSIAYSQVDGDRFSTYLVDPATGELQLAGRGSFPEWLDQDTLIVEVP